MLQIPPFYMLNLWLTLIQAMGEWGTEEHLFAFAEEGEGILGAEGVRRPQQAGNWVDVIAESKSPK